MGGVRRSSMTEGSTPGPDPSVTDEEILQVFHATDDPVLSTAEVAEVLPIKRRSVLNRLESLRDEGVIEKKTVGGRNSVWWIASEQSES